jgi:hypothetical protein
VLGELVRPRKRRGNGEKEGGRGGGGDRFKLAHRGGGRPAGWFHTVGECRERGRERGGGQPTGRRCHDGAMTGALFDAGPRRGR